MATLDYYNKLGEKTSSRMASGRYFSLKNYTFDIFKDLDGKLHFSAEDTVLDLGGGTGEIAQHIAPRVKALTLADGADKAIAAAQRKLKHYTNITYSVFNFTIDEFPFTERFDKIVCYQMAMYLESPEQFKEFVGKLLRSVKDGGVICIGDIPLSEKYSQSLEERKKFPLKNFILNQKYYLKRLVTELFLRFKKIDSSGNKTRNYTRDELVEILKQFQNIRYTFLEQNKALPFANSREDLIIRKILQ